MMVFIEQHTACDGIWQCSRRNCVDQHSDGNIPTLSLFLGWGKWLAHFAA